jgi:hypothetical protein
MKIEIEYMSMIYVLISVIKVFERLLGLTWKSVIGVVWGGGGSYNFYPRGETFMVFFQNKILGV